MKTFKLDIHRVYKCEYEYEAESVEQIEEMINWGKNKGVTEEMCEEFWEKLGEQELEQMNVDTTDYKIYEKGKEQPWKRVE